MAVREGASAPLENKCAKCGACTVVCPLYQVTGRETNSARGKIHLLDKLAREGGKGTKHLGQILSACLLCGACADTCPRGIDMRDRLATARGAAHGAGSHRLERFLIRKTLATPSLLAFLGQSLEKNVATLLRFLPAESGLRLRLGLGDSEALFESAPEVAPVPERESRTQAMQLHGLPGTGRVAPTEIFFFSGCHATYLDPTIAASFSSLLERSGNRITLTKPGGQTCCGLAVHGAGGIEEARRLAQINITAFDGSDFSIVTPCASCLSHLLAYPDLLADDAEWRDRALAFAGRLVDVGRFLLNAEIFSPALSTREMVQKKWRVYFHAPCHSRFGRGKNRSVQELLAAYGDIDLLHADGGNAERCCGMGGLFHLAHPALAMQIATPLVEVVKALQPDVVLSSCSGCLMQLRRELGRAGLSIPVRHYLAFLADAGI